ncbi:MAG: DUF4260 domain-containing protein, partial [Chloroflexota bacterium]
LEGAAVLALSILLYAYFGFSWWYFAIFLLAPDLTGFFYFGNKRVFTMAYNLAHTLIFPLLLGGISLLYGSDLGIQIALIWLAHIGMDRAVGYGLKYPTAFKDTHLSRV